MWINWKNIKANIYKCKHKSTLTTLFSSTISESAAAIYTYLMFTPETESILFVCLLFGVPLQNISRAWRRHHWRWRAEKVWPMLSTCTLYGLWAGRTFRKSFMIAPKLPWRKLRFLCGLTHFVASRSRIQEFMLEGVPSIGKGSEDRA